MPWPTAARMVQRPDCGLSIAWEGRVWLNPPYGAEASVWLERLAEHGNGIALVFARTETQAFHRHVWERADGILFLEGRIHFYSPDGTRAKANGGAPSVLIAYGQANAEALKACKVKGAFVPLERRERGDVEQMEF